MTNDEFNNVLRYKAVMSIVEKWLKNGLITEREYTEIDTIISEKYGIFSCSIYRSNCLI